MILGGGPNRIGQGIEFDYCCCHASFALRDEGYETISTADGNVAADDRMYIPIVVDASGGR